MKMKRLVLCSTIVVLGASFVAKSWAQQRDLWEEDFASMSSQGRRVFTSNCAGCHGLDGRGGKGAPGIASGSRVEKMRDVQVTAIVSNGVAGTGMPAFRSLSPLQVHSVVGYVRFLQGQNAAQKLPGDPARGKDIFLGKGECSTCHAMRGEGGFTGPDLTSFGTGRSVREVLDAISSPRKAAAPPYRPAVVVTGDGQRVSGLVRNEDNFSLQLQTDDGAFHFFQKADLKSVEYSEQSAMPAYYGDRLTRTELDDLASYLMGAARMAKPAPPPEKH